MSEKLDEIIEKVVQTAEDVAVIKNILVGNGQEGIVKKVERHEKYLYMCIGGAGLIGVGVGILQII